jgi:hypothetical protein
MVKSPFERKMMIHTVASSIGQSTVRNTAVVEQNTQVKHIAVNMCQQMLFQGGQCWGNTNSWYRALVWIGFVLEFTSLHSNLHYYKSINAIIYFWKFFVNIVQCFLNVSTFFIQKEWQKKKHMKIDHEYSTNENHYSTRSWIGLHSFH